MDIINIIFAAIGSIVGIGFIIIIIYIINHFKDKKKDRR